jgi:predicted nucleic acid-binding protein
MGDFGPELADEAARSLATRHGMRLSGQLGIVLAMLNDLQKGLPPVLQDNLGLRAVIEDLTLAQMTAWTLEP